MSGKSMAKLGHSVAAQTVTEANFSPDAFVSEARCEVGVKDKPSELVEEHGKVLQLGIVTLSPIIFF